MHARTWLAFAVVLLALATSGCMRLLSRGPKPFVRGPEALQWLKENKNPSALAANRFGTTANAIDFVERLYDAGAERVFIPVECIELEENGQEYADALVVKLPKHAASRERVLKICAAELERAGFDPEDCIEDDRIVLFWD